LNPDKHRVINEIKFYYIQKRVDISMDFKKGTGFPCPLCNDLYSVYETDTRAWRYLNIFQNPTYIQENQKLTQ
jgi:hypothetical protein